MERWGNYSQARTIYFWEIRSCRGLKNETFHASKSNATFEQTQKFGHQIEHRFSLVTVCNWNSYQNGENEKGQREGHSDGQPKDTDKNNKNVKKKRIGDPKVNEFKNFFYTEFEKRFGERYVASHAKDGKIVKSLLIQFDGDIEKLKDRALQFFALDDPFIRNKVGYTLETFKSKINVLASRGNNHGNNHSGSKRNSPSPASKFSETRLED